MEFSCEWIDWHLTPDGWVPGNYKTDFNGVIKVEPPANRVLTRRYEESISSISSPLKIFRKNIWASKDTNEIKRLFRKYEFPNTLARKIITTY